MIKDLKAAYVLVALNVAIWILGVIQSFSGLPMSLPLDAVTGGIYVPDIVIGGQWYRIITAMFLHDGFYHLASNMLALFLLGRMMERMMGSLRFILTYFIAGIGGNLVALYWDLINGDYFYTLGASGAILGLVGALLAVSVNKHDGIPGVNVKRALIACVLMLIPTSSNVSMTAHLGGFVFGFAAAYIIGSLFPVKKSVKR